jgi:hypothetical protein
VELARVYAPHFRLKCFESLTKAEKFQVLHGLLEALTLANCWYLRANPHTPKLYDAGVRYLEEAPGFDEWQDIPDTLARRSGDCEDLASWRVAELRMGGEPGATHEISVEDLLDKRTGEVVTTYHIFVKRADGSHEDPSRLLGMP